MNNVGVLAMGPPESLPLGMAAHPRLNVMSVARSNVVFLPLLLSRARAT
jgi:hypothetical protein